MFCFLLFWRQGYGVFIPDCLLLNQFLKRRDQVGQTQESRVLILWLLIHLRRLVFSLAFPTPGPLWLGASDHGSYTVTVFVGTWHFDFRKGIRFAKGGHGCQVVWKVGEGLNGTIQDRH